MDTSLLHESIKQSIFDMDHIKEMSATINKELEEYRQSLGRGEDGRIPESIVPNRDQPERVAEADLVEEATGKVVGEPAIDESMEIDYGGDADDDEEEGENAGPQIPGAEQRIDMVMGPVEKVHSPDTSMLITKKDSSGHERTCVLPNWAIDRYTAKCVFCLGVRQIDPPLVEGLSLKCLKCQGRMMIAEEIAAEMSDHTWTTNPGLMAEILRSNRRDHVSESDQAATEPNNEVKVKSPQMTEGTLNKVFGHDQTGIEGFDICETTLRNSLNEEKSERDACTEFEGAVRTKRESDTQKGDDDSQEHPTLDEQDANDEREDPHDHHSGRTETGSYLENKANMLFHKLKATIQMISPSITGRGKMIVETAVKNDNRPVASLAANNTAKIYNDPNGVPYSRVGAESARHLIQTVGLPPMVTNLPVPYPYEDAKTGKFEGKYNWIVLDEQFSLPSKSVPDCQPHTRTTFDMSTKCPWERKAWDQGSRTLNKILRHGSSGVGIQFMEGGWVAVDTALDIVRRDLNRTYNTEKSWWVGNDLSTKRWLYGLLLDVDRDREGGPIKSRFQLAGVVNGSDTLVEICYVRCKSGHGTQIAESIPDGSLYTKIEEKHLPLISRVCHKTKLEHVMKIFLLDLIPGGEKYHNKRAHSNFTPFPPFDKRNIAAGRLGGEFNAVIVYNKRKLLKYNLRIAMSAVLVTDSNIPWTVIDLIYVVPSYNHGSAWVLYDPDLVDREIKGHTLPSDGSAAWGAKALGSYTDDVDGQVASMCGTQECPNCKAFNPNGFTSCLRCHVKFTFDDIKEESKEAKGGNKRLELVASASKKLATKSGNAGPASSSVDLPSGIAPVPGVEKVLICESLKAARRMIREDQGKNQSFSKPSVLLWELVNGNMKWRLRWDQRRSVEEKQQLVNEGCSRFCAGTHFGALTDRNRARPLGYGGPTSFLHAQAAALKERDAEGNYTTECIKIKKIFVVAVMVDFIEDWFPRSIESADSILDVKKNSGHDSEFMKSWSEALADVLEEQEIDLDVLMTAEMVKERRKSDKLSKFAEILRKPNEAMTADDVGFMNQRIVERHSNIQSGGSSVRNKTCEQG